MAMLLLEHVTNLLTFLLTLKPHFFLDYGWLEKIYGWFFG